MTNLSSKKLQLTVGHPATSKNNSIHKVTFCRQRDTPTGFMVRRNRRIKVSNGIHSHLWLGIGTKSDSKNPSQTKCPLLWLRDASIMAKNPFMNIPRNSLQVKLLVNWDNLEPSERTDFRYRCTQEQFHTERGRPGTHVATLHQN